MLGMLGLGFNMGDLGGSGVHAVAWLHYNIHYTILEVHVLKVHRIKFLSSLIYEASEVNTSK